MDRFNNPLDHVRIAAPCKADWQQMIGTERVRFCGQCNRNVYNLSRMTRAQAESLIAQTEGRLCVRFYRRSDGSILTNNCPVGLRAIRRRLSYLAKAASGAVLSFFAGLGVYWATSLSLTPPLMGAMAVAPNPLTTPRIDVPVESMLGRVVLKHHEAGFEPVAQAEVGEVLISHPLPSPVESKARRRRGKSRTASTSTRGPS